MKELIKIIKEPFNEKKVELPLAKNWKEFTYSELFDIERGKGPTATESKKEENKGNVPYAGASNRNNGITAFTNFKPIYPKNTITVGNAGNGGAGLAYYQPFDYNACSTVNILFPKFELNPFIGLFLVSIISQEHYKYNFGHGWSITRMKESKISLPVDSDGNPDWQLMEDYIKSLPYSKYL